MFLRAHRFRIGMCNSGLFLMLRLGRGKVNRQAFMYRSALFDREPELHAAVLRPSTCVHRFISLPSSAAFGSAAQIVDLSDEQHREA
jgi:hypothetical protein